MQIRPMKQSEAEIVRDLWNEACIQAVGYPLGERSMYQILINLRQYAIHNLYHCLVLVDDDKLLGYITFGISGHAIEPGLVGEIEELYVQEGYAQEKSKLVYAAVVKMKQQGAGVITTRVAIDEPDDLAFWKSLNWEQDTVNFNIYRNVPADPESQAVWDKYQA